MWPYRGSPAVKFFLIRRQNAQTKDEKQRKKRFKRTATGKIKFKPAGKRHGMSKRSNKFIRNTKKSSIMAPSDAALIDHMLPYNK